MKHTTELSRRGGILYVETRDSDENLRIALIVKGGITVLQEDNPQTLLIDREQGLAIARHLLDLYAPSPRKGEDK